MSKIYMATWHTESGDEGVVGYWDRRPTEGELTAVFKKIMPDEFDTWNDEPERRMVWWEVHELKLEELPEPVAEVPSI